MSSYYTSRSDSCIAPWLFTVMPSVIFYLFRVLLSFSLDFENVLGGYFLSTGTALSVCLRCWISQGILTGVVARTIVTGAATLITELRFFYPFPPEDGIQAEFIGHAVDPPTISFRTTDGWIFLFPWCTCQNTPSESFHLHQSGCCVIIREFGRVWKKSQQYV